MLNYKIRHKEISELILKQIKAFGANYASKELTKFIYGASGKQGDYLDKRIRSANLSEEKKQELIGELRRVCQGIKERYNAITAEAKPKSPGTETKPPQTTSSGAQATIQQPKAQQPKYDTRIRTLDFYINTAYTRLNLEESVDESNLDEINSLLEDSSKLLGSINLPETQIQKYTKRLKIAHGILEKKYGIIGEENYIYYSTMAQHLKANAESGIIDEIFSEIKSMQAEIALFRMPTGKRGEVRQMLNNAWDIAKEKNITRLEETLTKYESILTKKNSQIVEGENEIKRLAEMKKGTQANSRNFSNVEIDRFITEKQTYITSLQNHTADITGKIEGLKTKLMETKGKNKKPSNSE